MTTNFETFLTDLFSGLGPVRVRRMFGGMGVYAQGVQFALSLNETIYIKTDERLAGELAQAGSEPFVYEAKGRSVTLAYWRLPETALDDGEEACAWGRRSLAIALAARSAPASKPKPGPRRAGRSRGR